MAQYPTELCQFWANSIIFISQLFRICLTRIKVNLNLNFYQEAQWCHLWATFECVPINNGLVPCCLADNRNSLPFELFFSFIFFPSSFTALQKTPVRSTPIEYTTVQWGTVPFVYLTFIFYCGKVKEQSNSHFGTSKRISQNSGVSFKLDDIPDLSSISKK